MKKPLIKCSCIYCNCDLATSDGVCYECTRGLHASNEWKDGFKLRKKPKGVQSIQEMKSETILQMNIANEEMSIRVDVMEDLLAEIEAYAIRDVFEGRKCLLCFGVIGLDRSQEDLQHAKDCPLIKIPKLKGD